MIQGLGHITFSVSDMKRSVQFYQTIFSVNPIVYGEKTAYFEVANLWIALNLEENIGREEIYNSYTHTAFSVQSEDLPKLRKALEDAHATIVTGRNRSIVAEGESIYFRDPDGHLLEFHTGSLKQRLAHLKKTNPTIVTDDANLT